MRCGSTCVSTTTPAAIPYAVPSTTLAVFRAAPGMVSISSIVFGTAPPNSAHHFACRADNRFRFVKKEAGAADILQPAPPDAPRRNRPLAFSRKETPVSVRAQSEDGNLIFTVTDTGRGMTPKQLAQVGAFRQPERTNWACTKPGLIALFPPPISNYLFPTNNPTMTHYLLVPQRPVLPAIRGQDVRFPYNRLFFVGRNYHAHAVGNGPPGRQVGRAPFLLHQSARHPDGFGRYRGLPAQTKNYHFEVELVVAIGKAGFRVQAEDAHTLIYGYAAGLDMTRRDLQFVARDKGRPWDLGEERRTIVGVFGSRAMKEGH